MEGRILKGVGGFYCVDTGEALYECRAKGGFRKEGISPLVGDRVEIVPEPGSQDVGTIVSIRPRSNELIRPRSANADQIFLVFSAAVPRPSFELLNRYLVVMAETGVPVVLIVTKADLMESEAEEEIRKAFRGTAYPIRFCSSKTGAGIEEVRETLYRKMTVFAGPSGVGKSSLVNALIGHAAMEVGALSKKIERGKNTTRHTELFAFGESTYILDTPGFSSIDYDFVEKDNLALNFEEFIPYLTKCRYSNCTHRKEEDCAVRAAVSEGKLSEVRYRCYVDMMDHLLSLRRYS
ncbi:MAG: ribosome small subunit-dependent GTPase A [Lachnospiraceae bacterium]|nr:ribosome small subunit-dependent GTPase A [Lachnospiraceae bacterium]